MLELIAERIDVGDLLLAESVGLDETSVATMNEVRRTLFVVRPFRTSLNCEKRL